MKDIELATELCAVIRDEEKITECLTAKQKGQPLRPEFSVSFQDIKHWITLPEELAIPILEQLLERTHKRRQEITRQLLSKVFPEGL